jgi:hypothetical protein
LKTFHILACQSWGTAGEEIRKTVLACACACQGMKAKTMKQQAAKRLKRIGVCIGRDSDIEAVREWLIDLNPFV